MCISDIHICKYFIKKGVVTMTDENDILLSNIEEEINNILNSFESEEEAVEELLELGLNIDDVESRLNRFLSSNQDSINKVNNDN